MPCPGNWLSNWRRWIDSYHARLLLAETEEARELLRLNPLYSLIGLWDIRSSLRHA